MRHLYKGKLKKAYSLIEVVISLAIIAVILTILFNTILVTLRISYRNFTRSFVREEVAQATTLLSRDIRNADEILNCGGITESNSCTVVRDNTLIRWELCADSICRAESLDGNNFTTIFETADTIEVSQFTFINGFALNPNAAQQNIVFTLVAGHENEDLNISNVIRQQSVSTRNYTR